MKNLLVTGGAGFIGSNFVRHVLAETNHRVINLDLLTYAGNLENLTEVEGHERYTFVKADIADPQGMDRLFSEHPIDRSTWDSAAKFTTRSIGCSENSRSIPSGSAMSAFTKV